MLPPRVILAALDFSAGAEAALVRAMALAARSDADLHIVHAVPSSDADHEADSMLRVRLERHVADVLGLEVGEGHPSVQLWFAIVHGPSVTAAIMRHAKRIQADLLVLGTHGRSGSRLLVGNVTEACVAAAPCPVLTVPPEAEIHELSPVAPVLVAVDFGDLSRVALAVGREKAALYGAELECVHVVRDAGPFTGLVPSVLDLEAVDPGRASAVRQRLSRFEADVPETTLVALGRPSRMIAALADARGAGVVVMGTHGRRGVTHAILGSTTGATLERATCAVLTVRGVSHHAALERPARQTAVAA
ncbi:universal stress protein [Rubrivirga sp.]|uniref:universal stress protein n=1 Tax=Rubrivirga sp. TaxID=1885344 RepID=UPI003C7347A9